MSNDEETSALDQALANREEVDASRQIAEAEAVSLYVLETRPCSVRGVELLTDSQIGSAGPPGLTTCAVAARTPNRPRRPSTA